MAPIVVEPEVLAGAGVSISAVGDQIAAAVSTLAGALPNGAMAGHDKAGLVFGQAYQQAANALMDAGAAAANGGRQVGFGVQMSATNYSRADASSTIGGGTTPLTPPTAPDKFEAPSVPSPFGGGVAEPFLWSMVQAFVGDLWPNGDPTQLRAAAAAWSTFARTMAGIGGELAGATTTISGQQIPEGGAMATHLSTLTKGLSDISTESAKLGVQIFEFAADVEVAQNAIRDLLSRLSPEGIWDGLGAIFSGDALEELQEIADDIRTVLDNLGRQVDARKQGLQYLTQLLDESVVALEKVIRREFVQYLGEDVGNPLATVVDTWLNSNEGFLKWGLESMGGLLELDPMRFAYDFEGAAQAWGNVVEPLKYATPMGIALDPMGAAEFGQNAVKEISHVEEWTTDRPGLGPAMMAAEVGSMFIPGMGALKATKPASIADDVAGAGPGVRAAGVLDNAAADASEIAGRAEGITNELNKVGDNILTGPAASPSGPAIPPSLVDPPSPPHVGDTPTPRAPDIPPPHVPDSAPGDRTFAPTPHAGQGDAGPRSDAPPLPINANAEPRMQSPTDIPTNINQISAPAGASVPSGNGLPASAAPGDAPEPAQVEAHAWPSHPPDGANSTPPEATPPNHPDSHGAGSGGDSGNYGNDNGRNFAQEPAPTHEKPVPTESPNEPHRGDDSQHPEEKPDHNSESIPPEDIPPPLVRDTPYETGGIQPEYVGEQYPGGPMGSPGVTYLDDAARELHRITIRDGLVYDARGNLFDTQNGVSAFGPSSSGRAIFVMDEHGNLYASTYQAFREFHHSSLLGGRDVSAAGELVVKDGRIELLTDRSGHYMPGRSRTQQVLDQLESQGIVIDPSNVDYFAPPGS